MSNGLKEDKARPASDATLPSPYNQYDTELATLDAKFDRAFDGLEAELPELQRDLEGDLGAGLDPEIAQLADELLGPVLLDNTKSLKSIYQGPEGEAHFQQLLSSISEQHSRAADAESPSALGSGGPGAIPPFRNPPYSGGNNPTNPDQQNTTEPKTARQLRAPSPSSSPQRDATPETAEDPTQPLPPAPLYNIGSDFQKYWELRTCRTTCEDARTGLLRQMERYNRYAKLLGVNHKVVVEAEARLKQLQLEFATLRQKLREVLPDTPGPTAQPPGGSSPQSPNPSQRPPGQPPVNPPQGGGNTAADTERLVRPPSAQPPVAPPAAELPQTPQAQPRPGADLRNVAEPHRPPYTD